MPFREMTAAEYVKLLASNPEDYALLPISLAADRLRCTPAHVRRQIADGDLEGVTISHRSGEKNTRGVFFKSIRAAMNDRAAEQVCIVESMLLDRCTEGGDLFTYKELMDAIGLDHRLSQDRKRIGQILGEISENSYAAKKIMLSVLAVSQSTKRPNKSFFQLAKQLKAKKRGQSDEDFFQAQIEILEKDCLFGLDIGG